MKVQVLMIAVVMLLIGQGACESQLGITMAQHWECIQPVFDYVIEPTMWVHLGINPVFLIYYLVQGDLEPIMNNIHVITYLILWLPVWLPAFATTFFTCVITPVLFS